MDEKLDCLKRKGPLNVRAGDCGLNQQETRRKYKEFGCRMQPSSELASGVLGLGGKYDSPLIVPQQQFREAIKMYSGQSAAPSLKNVWFGDRCWVRKRTE